MFMILLLLIKSEQEESFMCLAYAIHKCNEVTNNIFHRDVDDVVGLLRIVITCIL